MRDLLGLLEAQNVTDRSVSSLWGHRNNPQGLISAITKLEFILLLSPGVSGRTSEPRKLKEKSCSPPAGTSRTHKCGNPKNSAAKRANKTLIKRERWSVIISAGG